MSFNGGVMPLHLPTHQFTSTMQHIDHKRPLFNVKLVLLTALFFFLVLSYYNFTISLYNLIVNNTTKDISHETLQKNTVLSLIFCLVWTVISLIGLFILWPGNEGSGDSDYWKSHPTARGSAKSVDGNVEAMGMLRAL